jgi:hypothetical protein
MVDFKNAAIYQIVDDVTGMRYIGSTCEPTLAKRLAKHRANYKDWVRNGKGYMTSFEILATGRGKIELIEKCDVNSRDELRAREGHWIRELECVNKVVVGRTRKEYNQLPENKERRNEHRRERWANDDEYREKQNVRARERRATDEEWREKMNARLRTPEYRERQNERRRERRETDPEYREKENERKRAPEYRERENVRKRASPKVACEHCGSEVKQAQMKRHQMKSNKCLAARAAKADPLIEQKREWKQEPIRCEVCGATTTKGNYAQHKKAKYCLEAAAAKAEQGL